jgi:antimicrobial peptide system SdpB family protein
MRLKKVCDKLEREILQNPIWTNSYGLSRSILALGTLANFLFNHSSILFRPGVGMEHVPICRYYNSYSLFCFLNDNLEIARIITILILVVVATGWRPRITGILHWYIMFSYTTSATVLDGGDHITTILAFMLVPITLTDNRKWHWDSSRSMTANNSNLLKSLIAKSTVLVIKFQVSLIYLNSAGAKLLVEEWQNGTAVYYWFTHPTFGAPEWLRPLIIPLITNEYAVTAITWLSILFEFFLFAAIIATIRARRVLFILGISFHFLIFMIHGLFSFFLAMSAALILYLSPLTEEIKFFKRIRLMKITKLYFHNWAHAKAENTSNM